MEKYKSVVKSLEGLKVSVESRGFVVECDEPLTLGGANTAMSPVELLLGSLGACQVIATKALSKAFGINIEEMKVEVEGGLDLGSFTGTNPNAPKGFRELNYNFHIKSDASDEKLFELIRAVEKICPVGQTLMQEVKMNEAKLTRI